MILKVSIKFYRIILFLVKFLVKLSLSWSNFLNPSSFPFIVIFLSAVSSTYPTISGLVLFNYSKCPLPIEIDGLQYLLKMMDLSMAMLNNQRVISNYFHLFASDPTISPMFLVSQVVFFLENEAKLQLLQPPERPFTSLVGGFRGFFWEKMWSFSVCWLRSGLEVVVWSFFVVWCWQNCAKTGPKLAKKEEVGTCGHVKDFMSKTRTVQRLQCLFMKCQNYFWNGICPMYIPQSLARPAPIHHHHHIVMRD